MRRPITVKNEYLSLLIAQYGYLLDVNALCAILAVSRPTVDKMIENGELPVAKIGNRARVATSDFVTWWDDRVAAQQKEQVRGCLRK